MDIKPQQPISDDQELAKVLAGITAGADGAVAPDLAVDLEQAAAPESKKKGGNAKDDATSDDAADDTNSVIDTIESTVATEPISITPQMPEAAPTPAPTPVPAAPATDSGLEAIKHDALTELRPLVDKLNLSAEEKFDTYLLLIRSTDDKTLIAPAFEAARGIGDETSKAQALFDIVKEIDYLSNPQQAA